MTGLILKDALVLKKSLKSYLLLLAVYAVLTVTGLFSISFVAAFLEVIAMMLPMSAFAFDEQAHWDRYAAALPLSRRDLVAARYLFTLLVLLCAAAFGAAMCAVLSFSGDWDAVTECGMSIAATLLLGVLALCAYPFLQLGIQYLLYKLTAFLASVIGDTELCGLIGGLGGAFGLILGMVGSCALVLLVSILASAAVVTS